ncbi:MAG: hypothetical protein EA349_13185 [Halomonadaceae bacterium]|nr:MAG: hypothetical protein EA349_13185 [Halomonadaceae bacterium]
MNKHSTPWFLLSLVLLFSGCALFEEEMDRRTPTASVEGTRIAALSFDSVDLMVDVRIDNPNPVGVRLAGLDYDLRLDGERALSGSSDNRSEIPARDSGVVSIPITLGFKDLYGRVGGLRGKNEVGYDLDLGLSVDVPLLGVRRLSANTASTLPLPRPPQVSLGNVRVDHLGLTGARILMDLGVTNPNRFGLDLDALRYSLTVEGQSWISGLVEETTRVSANQNTTLTIPVDLNFASLGTGLYRMLTESRALDYQLQGSMTGTAGDSALGRFDLDFEDLGNFRPGR